MVPPCIGGCALCVAAARTISAMSTRAAATVTTARTTRGGLRRDLRKYGPEQVAVSRSRARNLKEDLHLGDWPLLGGFIPKHATRYGCPDASCMAG